MIKSFKKGFGYATGAVVGLAVLQVIANHSLKALKNIIAKLEEDQTSE